MLTRFLNSYYAACLSPHPDDCEYAMSATVSKYYDTQFHVYNISSGGKYSSKELDRLGEVKEFWSSYKNVELIFVGEEFIRDIEYDTFIKKMEDMFNLYEYDLILAPPDEDTHQDHRKINRIANSLTRSKKMGVVEYMTPSTKIGWVPNLYVNIGDEIERKRKNLFNSFQSQLDKPYFTDNVFNLYHSNYRTSKRNLDNAEFFKVRSLYQ
jgi:LmbE family N-acetylglucosaminyl deacetylase|tara:strand:+ start:635 stop:1264 length:630 start_codon:yes stop_codon:yes gene_type:complete